PLVCDRAQRRKEPCLEPANRMRRTEKIPVQLPGINLRTVGIGEEHDKFYRRLAAVWIRGCLTPSFSRAASEMQRGDGCKRMFGRRSCRSCREDWGKIGVTSGSLAKFR